jgi:holo-[acyl-carrier protein] synthase
MIRIYQGVDLVHLPKFRQVFERHPGFAADLFTEQERAYCLSGKDPLPHFAGRFAAKEACLKALGLGFSGTGIDHALQEIEVLPRASGRPNLDLHGWLRALCNKRGIHQWSVSLSHASEYAVATVVMVGDGD